MRKLRRSPFDSRSARGRRFSPLVLVGVIVSLAIALIGAVVFLLPHRGSHAAVAVNGDCALIVPSNPLTAQGLATPYQLVTTNRANAPWNEPNPAQTSFAEAALNEPAAATITVDP